MRPDVSVAIHLYDGDGTRACDPMRVNDYWFVTVDLAKSCTIYASSPESLRLLADAAIDAANKLEAAMEREPKGLTP